MQCYTELTEPTAVTHSINVSFTGPDATNLIVAKTSLLQIFTIKTITGEKSSESKDGDSADNNNGEAINNEEKGFDASFMAADSIQRAGLATTTKLVLVAEYHLAGTVTSMARIKIPESKSGGEALLIAFRDAKVSLIEWDPARCGIYTISIHYYEQDQVPGSPWDPVLNDTINYLVADPGSRCAALKFGARNLAILPFKQDNDVDVEMADWDEDLDGPRPESKPIANGTATTENTPYSPSFVLRLSSLDISLIHPLDLAFLHEYREPTFGILSSMTLPSTSLLDERRDQLSYMVFTLDLAQKASTTILVVNNLPYDLFKIVAMPAPLGGSILIGGNEIIHIDQSGKTNGVAVNNLAKVATSFGLADQSDLALRLEGCAVERLGDTGDLLIILNTGELVTLSFRMDGRSVSGLRVRKIDQKFGVELIGARPSALTRLSKNTLFVGSEEADSVVLGWSKKTSRAKQVKQSDESDEEMEDFDDDDLYGDGPTPATPKFGAVFTSSNDGDEFVFRIHDSMLNIASLRDVAIARPTPASESSDVVGNLELIGASGRNRSGALSVMKREVEPKVIGRFDFSEAHGVWTMSAKRPVPKGLQNDGGKENAENAIHGNTDMEVQFDRLMIVSKIEEKEGAAEESAVYALTDAGFEALTDTEFEPAAGATIECGTVGNGMRVIQVLKSEVRSYDGDLGLAQILPMFDDETGAEPKIVAASIVDPFILLIRDDASIFVAQCDEDNELEEVERADDALVANKWLTGCLYKDTSGIFYAKDAVIMALLNTEGTLFIYALPDLATPIYTASGVTTLPPAIAPDYAAKRYITGETITELVIADIGDTTSADPFLVLRSARDDLIIYKPYIASSEPSMPLSKKLHFVKLPNPHFPKSVRAAADEIDADTESTKRNLPMRAIANLSGFSTVFMPGPSATFILKSAQTTPRVLGLRGHGARSLSSFHTAGCERGFIYIDTTGVSRVCELPSFTDYTSTGMVVRKIPLGEEVVSVSYHAPKNVYCVGTQKMEEFELPKDDEYYKKWAEENISFRPLTPRGTIKLLDPATAELIDQYELDPHEFICTMKVLSLETSEIPSRSQRKDLLVLGTAVSRGEDLAIRGRVYVFDIISVVAIPSKPWTNKGLKLLGKEEIPRGAVTALSAIGTQGFLVIGQGQKAMVRGLKEDGTLLPVAFMDMGTYISDISTLGENGGEGLVAFADPVRGVGLVGYAEEPYKMLLVGKQSSELGAGMGIFKCCLLPVNGELYIIGSDRDGDLHVLQYDPEHPKSLHGHLLLHLSSFCLSGAQPTTMTLLPSVAKAAPSLLLTLSTGSLAILQPLPETTYRNLITLSNHLYSNLYHACGLNPKARRIVTHAPEPVVGGRVMVDGNVVRRLGELGTGKRADVMARLGTGAEEEIVRQEVREMEGGWCLF